MDLAPSYWRFVEDWHPKYYSDDRVLTCDILLRYMEGEDVCKEDEAWIAADFNSREDILQELKRLETELFAEALDCYYDRYLA